MPDQSPYNYAFNNPVFWIDPDGRMPEGAQTSYGTDLSSAAGSFFGTTITGSNTSTDENGKKVTTDTKTYADTVAGREGLVNEMNEMRGSEGNCCPVPKDVINLGKQLEDNLKSLIGAEKKYTRKKLVPTKIVSDITTLATTQGMAIGGGSSLSNSIIIRTGEEVWIDLKLVNIDAMPEIIKKEIHFYEYLSGSFRVIETTTIEYKKLNIFTKTLNNLTKFMNYFDLHRTHTFNQIKTYKNSTDYNSGVLLEYLN